MPMNQKPIDRAMLYSDVYTYLHNVYFTIKSFLVDIYVKRYVIYELAKRDFQAKNKASYLGPLWGCLQPMLFVLLLWFVFSIGLKTNPGQDVPFVVYLISGKVAWIFFTESIGASATVIKQYDFLLKKGDFRLSILPIAKQLSSLISHVTLLGIAVFIGLWYGFSPGIYLFQVGYYFGGLFLLLLGLGWMIASTNIFVQDVSNIVSVIVQFGFWLTPIIWNISKIPERYQWIIQLNPMCYIVLGYRDSLVYKIPFWTKPYQTLYFWCVTTVIVVVGALVFRRLRPHFAEVL